MGNNIKIKNKKYNLAWFGIFFIFVLYKIILVLLSESLIYKIIFI